MPEVRWRASLRSWLGIAIGSVPALPAIGAVLTGRAIVPFTAVLFLVGVVLVVACATVHLVVHDEGLAVRPGGARLTWDDLDGFDTRGSGLASLRAYRSGIDRPVVLTTQPIAAARARALADRLNEELSASRTR